MLYIVSEENLEGHGNLIASMHRLRAKVFNKELGWDVRVINGMEFDQFDIPTAHHLVHMNDEGEVDACTRLLPTTGPTLLYDVFPNLMSDRKPKPSQEIWETTRFCADRTSAPRNITGILVAGMLEFGLNRGLTNYVSVSDIRIEPVLRRAGWWPERLGKPVQTGSDWSAGEIFEVSDAALKQVKRCSRLPDEPIIQNMHELDQARKVA